MPWNQYFTYVFCHHPSWQSTPRVICFQIEVIVCSAKPDTDLMLVRCWSSIGDAGLILIQHVGPILIPGWGEQITPRVDLENKFKNLTVLGYMKVMQSQKAVTAHLKSKQLLPFGFARFSQYNAVPRNGDYFKVDVSLISTGHVAALCSGAKPKCSICSL